MRSLPRFLLPLGLALAGGLASTACSGGGGTPDAVSKPAIQAVIAAHRLTGPAPLAVSFHGLQSSSPRVGTPFRDLQYTWDFGDTRNGEDPDGGRWQHGRPGPDGQRPSKNVGHGPLAGHVYQQPGTYEATLTVWDGTESHQSKVSIVVQDPDTVYAGTKTVVVAASGVPAASAAGVPTGARRLKATSMDGSSADGTPSICSLLTDDTRVLLKRGERYLITDSCSTSASNLQLGAWGDRSLPAPEIYFDPKVAKPAGACPHNGIYCNYGAVVVTGSQVTLMDLRGTGNTALLKDDAVFTARMVTGGSESLLLLRLQADGLSSLGTLSGRNLIVQDSAARHLIGGLGNVGLWAAATASDASKGYNGPANATGMRVMGNLLADAVGIEHNIRTQGMSQALYAHNSLAKANPTKALLTARGDPAGNGKTSGGQVTQHIQISDNVLGLAPDGALAGSGLVHAGPENRGSNEPIESVLFERNVHVVPGTDTSFAGGMTFLTGLVSRDMVVRNSIFIGRQAGSGAALSTGPAIHANVQYGNTAYGVPAPSSAYIQNNTSVSSELSQTFFSADNAAKAADAPSGVVLQNNLFWAPNAVKTGFGNTGDGHVVYVGSPDPVVLMQTNTLEKAVVGSLIKDYKTSPWTTAPTAPTWDNLSASLASLKPAASSYAIGNGTPVAASTSGPPPVLEDFYGQRRTGTSTSLGALQP
ncbi:PKD domain-containing protein [Ideonella livida]|uniref:PKD domain-containing protein n=1 Tax=Ideonella livida TaxID=2707176 RepID=A0A7C9PKJ5_9BURK|nr:PKD domain-containing protein [Ideonella livida]NDY93410.1 hypothetical protein [Ideonella livida]